MIVMAKILLVEDNPQAKDVLVAWLVIEKHHVEVAETGFDALQLLTSFEFELIILDWDLPNISGPEILKRFRADGGHAQVIFLTGKVDSISETIRLDARADDYLTKQLICLNFPLEFGLD